MRKLFKVGQLDHDVGEVLFKWQPNSCLLATAGINGFVHIFDRHGKRVSDFLKSGGSKILCLDWDYEGKCLAALQEGNPAVSLWDLVTQTVCPIETNLKDLTFLLWSNTGPQLAIGTLKGNILIYNKLTGKKIPVLGKHSGRITCGAWSSTNQLALASEDKTITLSNELGDTLVQIEPKFSVLELHFFSGPKNIEVSGISAKGLNADSYISFLGEKCIGYCRVSEMNQKKFSEIPCPSGKFSDLLSHCWLDNDCAGDILIGFRDGKIAVISTESNHEVYASQLHSNRIYHIAYSRILRRIAVAGDLGVKFLDTTSFKELDQDFIALNKSKGKICGANWSPDSQIFTVATTLGTVFNYLSHVLHIHSTCGSEIAYLTSLREVIVKDCDDSPVRSAESSVSTISLSVEPSFISLGSKYLGVGVNNTVQFYNLEDSSCVMEHEYPSKVDILCMNDKYAVALCSAKLYLRYIEAYPMIVQDEKIFPEDDAVTEVTAVEITQNMLIYGTKDGFLNFIMLSTLRHAPKARLDHGKSVKYLYPNSAGTCVLFIDIDGNGGIYFPATGKNSALPDFPKEVTCTIWDQTYSHIIQVFTKTSFMHTYVLNIEGLHGISISKLGPVSIDSDGVCTHTSKVYPIPPSHTPMVSITGNIFCLLLTGTVGSFVSESFSAIHLLESTTDVSDLKTAFCWNLALLNFEKAWEIGTKIHEKACFLALANRAMEMLNLNIALRVYQRLGDAGMVQGLQRALKVEDKMLLAGEVALLFGDYSLAQELMLASSRPISALEMRRDLLHLEQALKLAEAFEPNAVPEINLAYAQRLEHQGDFQNALAAYERAQVGFMDGKSEKTTGQFGIVRCTLRLNEVPRGVLLARREDNVQLYAECAEILQNTSGHKLEAAEMWKLSGQFHNAFSIYLSTRNLAQATLIASKVKQASLLDEYAKECEKAGKWNEAREAYERSHNVESVIRICLDNLDQPEVAFSIARISPNNKGADMVAKYCLSKANWQAAIEFLVLSQNIDEAFNLAVTHGQMDTFVQTQIGPKDEIETISQSNALRLARYYESEKDFAKAGKYYSAGDQYHRALKLLLQCGESELDRAIEVVGKAQIDMLTHTLIDYLMGETDGVPKDPNYIYRLYMGLGNYTQAAKTAVIIARQEQDMGNYKEAHGILYEMIRKLENHCVRVPQSLRSSFLLLHSYTLAKKLARRGEHEKAARMLLRVAQNASKFPTHLIAVLTSTVIECQRAGLNEKAYEYASTLMKPEYRNQIDKKYRRNIETIVRKPSREVDRAEACSPCPISGTPLPLTCLECPITRDALPMCIVTGQHMERENWTICPSSRFPALYSEYICALRWEMQSKPENESILKTGLSLKDTEWVGTDPILGNIVHSSDLRLYSADEVDEYIRVYNKTDNNIEIDQNSL